MSDRRVTVIIPTNKGGCYLEEAVTSVRAQTSPVHEILLVDDGAPAPGLASIADRLGVRHLRQEASGLSVARNTGAAAAEGDWIAYLDDDDVWHPERIEEQLRVLDRMPGAVASCTGGWYMDADGMEFGSGWPAPQAASSEMIAYAVVPPRITTLLIRRDIYLDVGGCRSSMEPAEDNDLILRLLQRGGFAAVDRALVGYRRHGANVTSRGLAGREANRRVLIDQLRTALAGGDAELGEQLRQHRRAFRRYAAKDNLGEFIEAVRRGDPAYAARLAVWGLRHAPVSSAGALVTRLTGPASRR